MGEDFDTELGYYIDAEKKFDKEEFNIKFKKLALKNGWNESDYSKFADHLLIRTNFKNVVKSEESGNYDITVTFREFSINLATYAAQDKKMKQIFDKKLTLFSSVRYDNTPERREQIIREIPYFAYILDYFNILDERYPNLSNHFRIYQDNFKAHGEIYYDYDDSQELNFEHELKMAHLADNIYHNISEELNEIVEKIIVPKIKESKILNRDDIYYKQEDIDQEIEKNPNYNYLDLPLYKKSDNSLLDKIAFRKDKMGEIENNIKKYIDENHHRTHIAYDPYAVKKLISSKIINNNTNQLKFKDFYGAS